MVPKAVLTSGPIREIVTVPAATAFMKLAVSLAFSFETRLIIRPQLEHQFWPLYFHPALKIIHQRQLAGHRRGLIAGLKLCLEREQHHGHLLLWRFGDFGKHGLKL